MVTPAVGVRRNPKNSGENNVGLHLYRRCRRMNPKVRFILLLMATVTVAKLDRLFVVDLSSSAPYYLSSRSTADGGNNDQLVVQQGNKGIETDLSVTNSLGVTNSTKSVGYHIVNVPEHESDDSVSHNLQAMAKIEAEKSVLARKDNGCVTTLNREKLPEHERSLLLFSAPPPLLEEFPSTLRTWDVALRGRGRLVIITNDFNTRKLCTANDIPTICVEHTDEGLPRLDKMFMRMHESQPSGIVAYINSDLSIDNFDPMYDFLTTTMKDNPLEQRRPKKTFEPFVETGEINEYYFIISTRIDIQLDGSQDRHTAGGYDFWAWNTKPDGPPLLPFDVPPFRFPYASYDSWLLDVLVQSGKRNAIDASAVVNIVHHEHKRFGEKSTWFQALQSGISGVYINRFLALKEPFATLRRNGDTGSPYNGVKYMLRFGTPIGCPYYAIKDAESGGIAIAKRRIFSNVTEDDPNFKVCEGQQDCPQRDYIQKLTETQVENMAIPPPVDGIKKRNGRAKKKKQLKGRKRDIIETAATNWRYTMKEQLGKHATEDGFVLLTAVNYGYRDHLINFKCTLDRVGMTDHFVIAALDEKIYRWGILQGLPIFLVSSAKTVPLSASGGDFGSDGFRKLTKLKSRAVLEVLRAGYSVVWSDVDIMWFVHPFDALSGFLNKHDGLAIQSNAPYKQIKELEARPDETVDLVKSDNPAGYRRLNSGLYVAPSNHLVISAFEEIVAHAAASKLSEQPSFDEILCERYPSSRRHASCTYRPQIQESADRSFNSTLSTDTHGSMHVELLDRFMFPNGAVLVGPNNRNIYVLGEKKFSNQTRTPLYAAHNNWILGEDLKKKRAQSAGWWFTGEDFSCRYHRLLLDD